MPDLPEQPTQPDAPAVAPATPAPATAPAAPQTKKKRGLINPIMADVIGGVSSVVVGTITAWQLIGERAYNNMSKLHIFEDIQQRREADGEALAYKIKHKAISQEAADKESTELVIKHAKLAEGRWEEIGAGTILKKWKKLRDHQKAEVILTAAAYGGIALGSILLLTRGMFNNKEQEELAEKGSPSGSLIQR